MIVTEKPDVLPATPRNAAYRREFYHHWGRENCIVCFTTHRAEYPLFRQTLSLKCIARGTETYFVDRRRITVSDDTYLLLNEGRVYGSVLDVPSGAYSFSIFFRPGLAPEVAGGLQRSLGQALDDGPPEVSVPVEFEETLRPHDASVSPVIRYLQRSISAGVRDAHWLEEQCQFVLTRLIRAQRARAPLTVELVTARAGQRAEVLRRLERAADFMHEHLRDEISLQDIAAAAHLSRFHFLRLFRDAHGCTPAAWLRDPAHAPRAGAGRINDAERRRDRRKGRPVARHVVARAARPGRAVRASCGAVRTDPRPPFSAADPEFRN